LEQFYVKFGDPSCFDLGYRAEKQTDTETNGGKNPTLRLLLAWVVSRQKWTTWVLLKWVVVTWYHCLTLPVCCRTSVMVCIKAVKLL